MTLASGVLTDSDFSDTFSTLYAIHAPGVAAGYDAGSAVARRVAGPSPRRGTVERARQL